MVRPALALAVVAALLTAGCLGSVSPAQLDAQAVQDEGWRESSRSSEDVANGMGEKVQISYRSDSAPQRGGVEVVTANDVPLLDESQFIPQALEDVERQYGIEFTRTGTQQVQLTNLGATVTADAYDIDGAPAEGRALIFTPPCDDFVVVVAWGTTGSEGGGFFGGGDEPSMYDQARSLAKTVQC